MMKKTVTLLCLIALVTSLTGCGRSVKPTESPSTETFSSTLEGKENNKEQEIKIVNSFKEYGVVEIVKGEFENSLLTIQIKNLSPEKTIAGYHLAIRYLDSNGEYAGDPKVYNDDANLIPPNEVSDPSSWEYVSFGQNVEVYIIMVGYTDGSEWIHPNFKDYYAQQKHNK